MVRPKFRYIAVKVTCTNKLYKSMPVKTKSNDLYKAIICKIKQLHGDYGLASIKTGFSCKYCNATTGVAILRVRHGPHRFLNSVLPIITEIGGTGVQLCTIRITATLHQAYIYLKEYQQQEFEKLLQISKSNCDHIKSEYMNLDPVQELLAAERRSGDRKA